MGKHDYLRKKYSETISKEQLYKICHMAKETARYYLSMGIIPCTIKSSKTHRYAIKLDDVIDFMDKRDAGLIPPRPRTKVLRPNGSAIRFIKGSKFYQRELRRYFMSVLHEAVYTPRGMAVEIGLSKTVILRYLQTGAVDAIPVGDKYKIPKEYVVDFMMTTRYQEGKGESARYQEIMDGAKELAERLQREEEARQNTPHSAGILREYNLNDLYSFFSKQAAALPDVISKPQLQTFLGVSDKTVQKILRSGEVKAVVIAQEYKIPGLAVKEYIMGKSYLRNDTVLRSMISLYEREQN